MSDELSPSHPCGVIHANITLCALHLLLHIRHTSVDETSSPSSAGGRGRKGCSLLCDAGVTAVREAVSKAKRCNDLYHCGHNTFVLTLHGLEDADFLQQLHTVGILAQF
uniref:Uncharacterized protein n=1 Tax=Knipowitschia caucasica TaxID=637954 RepID=A0AAV2IYP7_KNICA